MSNFRKAVTTLAVESAINRGGEMDAAKGLSLARREFSATMTADGRLTIRLDGGPGASSMNRLFQEIGPCTIDSKGNVVDNANSWSNISNMLSIGMESPKCRYPRC
jgi:hypothetical protein